MNDRNRQLAREDFVPRPFRLEVDDEECPTEVVAYGMTLPDDTAIAVGCDSEQRRSIARCSSAERAAWLFDASLVWLGDRPKGTD